MVIRRTARLGLVLGSTPPVDTGAAARNRDSRASTTRSVYNSERKECEPDWLKAMAADIGFVKR